MPAATVFLNTMPASTSLMARRCTLAAWSCPRTTPTTLQRRGRWRDRPALPLRGHPVQQRVRVEVDPRPASMNGVLGAWDYKTGLMYSRQDNTNTTDPPLTNSGLARAVHKSPDPAYQYRFGCYNCKTVIDNMTRTRWRPVAPLRRPPWTSPVSPRIRCWAQARPSGPGCRVPFGKKSNTEPERGPGPR